MEKKNQISHALIARINSAHHAAQKFGLTFLEQAIKAGEALGEARGQVAHGEWEDWVEANCDFSTRQARRYIQAAENKSRLDGANSLRQAIADIAQFLPAAAPKSDTVSGEDLGPIKTYDAPEDESLAEAQDDTEAVPDPEPVKVEATIVDVPAGKPAKAKPEKKPAEQQPFDEFVEQWETIKSKLKSLSIEMREWLQCDATSRKPGNEWAHFITYDASVGALNGIVRAIDDNVPGAVDAKSPGYLPVRSVKSREAMAKK